jgi:hypothetical protein
MHHIHCIIDVEVRVGIGGSKFSKRLLGILQSILAHQPPRRFRGQQDTNRKWYRPDPLDCKRHSIGPVCVPVLEKGAENSLIQQGSYHPADVDVRGQVGSERDWAHFGRVDGGQSLENSPWHATDFSNL